MITALPSHEGSFTPLRYREFRWQFAAQAVSVAGNTLSPVALSLGVLELTGSAGFLSAVLAASAVPTVIFLLVGGVWADRLPRNRLMVATNVICALTQASMGFMLITHQLRLGPALVCQFITGTAMAFYFPSFNGLTVHTVPASALRKANAMLSLTRSLAGSVGPLAASLLTVTVGAGWALLADGLAFLVSALLLARIALPAAASRAALTARRFTRDLADGFREVVSRDWVWSSIVSFMFSHLATAVFLVLGPTMLLARGTTAVGWGAVIAALSVGQLVGDVIALRFAPHRPMLTCRLVEMLYAPLLVMLAISAPIWVLLLAAVPAGAALTISDALWYTVLQQHLSEGVLSRVFSYDWMGSLALRPIGYVAAATVAGLIGGAPTLVVVVVLLLSAKLVSLSFADVRGLRFIVNKPILDQGVAG